MTEFEEWRNKMMRDVRDAAAFENFKKDKKFLEWFGGFIDGEGSFCLFNEPKKNIRLFFVVGVTDKEIMEMIYKKMGLGNLYNQTQSKKYNTKPFYRFQVTRLKELSKFLPVIMPHLKLKRKDADRMYSFIKKWLNATNNVDRLKIKQEFGLLKAGE